MDSDRVLGGATDIGGRVKEGLGSLTGDAKLQAEGTLDQIKGTAQNIAGQAKDAVRDAVDHASDYAQQASGYAREAYSRGQDVYERGRDAIPDSAAHAYRDGRQALTGQVQESPLAAILLAGAVGYGLAWLIHGRS